MKIYGLDFTSSPSSNKPIIVADCVLEGAVLRVTDLLRLTSFPQFEASLRAPGPWLAALDLPFGLPRQLIDNLANWPRSWEGYLSRLRSYSSQDFEDLLVMYKASRPTGDKEHRRRTDELAGALSPMKLHGVPLAKMFFEGAQRLLATDCSVLPGRPTESDRVVVEAAPGLVARSMIGRGSYKTETHRKQTQAKTDARREIVRRIGSEKAEDLYGLRVEMGQFLAEAVIAEPRGDLLDSVLGAMQGAWCWCQGPPGFGIPGDVDVDEGWIVDPSTAAAD